MLSGALAGCFSVPTMRRDADRVRIVLRIVIGDARLPRMDIGTAELLRGDDLAGRGLHQRRPAEEDGAWLRTMMLSSDIAGTGAAACTSPSRSRSAECPATTSGPGCRRCGRNAARRKDLVLQRQEGAAGSTVDAGRVFCRAMSWARRCFFTVIG